MTDDTFTRILRIIFGVCLTFVWLAFVHSYSQLNCRVANLEKQIQTLQGN